MTKTSNHNEEEFISFGHNQNTKILVDYVHENEFAEESGVAREQAAQDEFMCDAGESAEFNEHTTSVDYYFNSYSHLGLAADMATNEPPQRKRKIETTVEEIFPMAEKGKTLYHLEEGTYLPEKNGGGGYVSPPASSSDEDVDPVLEAEYYRQIRESGGFDLTIGIPNGSLRPHICSDDDKDQIGICFKLGLHWYNFENGSNIRLLRLVKYNSIFTRICTYYITADVMDLATDARFAFQTCVTRCPTRANFKIATEVCRIKPEIQVDDSEDKTTCHWNFEAIDDFYKGELRWLPDDALVQSSDKQQQYYEVQDSEIRENDWLNLYAEYAFYALWERRLTKLKFGAPLEIKNVVVQTREAIDSKEKLKARNAIFYISYRDCGLTEDHRAVVRRTTDGLPQHFDLEVKCLVG